MIALLLATTLSASPDMPAAVLNESELLALAEAEYRAGLESRSDSAKARPHFREAAAAYERLWHRGKRNPVLARNLAQAHLLAGDLAQAIRSYHLGLRVAAHDSDLRAGLTFAREQVRIPMTSNLAKEATARDRNTFLRYGPAWFFGVLAAGVYLVAVLALARGWMSRRPFWWIFGGVLAVLAILMAGAVLWEDKHLTDERAVPVVIVSNDGTALHRGNGTEFPLRIPERLPEGVELVVLSERGGWLQVQLSGGTIGWVDARQVIRIEPNK